MEQNSEDSGGLATRPIHRRKRSGRGGLGGSPLESELFCGISIIKDHYFNSHSRKLSKESCLSFLAHYDYWGRTIKLKASYQKSEAVLRNIV